jgi:hypothetical protein
MQATTTVRPDMPANTDRFQEPFFRRFPLRPLSNPLELDGGVTKRYSFPTLYADVGCAIGIFFCDYEAARALMPHPRLHPVRMPRGRSLVIFSCYEYRHVHQVWPYNEIAMSIPVLANARLRPPVLPMLADRLFPRFGYHVFHMPVTSRENQLRGNKIWGLPKVTQAIDIERRGDHSVTVARDDDGKPYFELSIPTGGAPAQFDVSGHLYSSLEGRILKARTCFQGRFAVRKDLRRLVLRDLPGDALTIGDGPAAATLRALKIERGAFQTRYTPSMSAAFDLPIDGWEIGR